MPKVLLTSVIRPFGGPGEGDSVGAELFHAQVTRAQGPFSPRQVIRCWAIDYIAENIRAPAVTLHYPSKEEFVEELKTGEYTHVGINFVVATFHKLREMAALVRRYAPNATLILGGYGTVLPDELLRPYGDAICREEGAGFMRRLLGEPTDGPIAAPHAPIPAPSILSVQEPSIVGHVTAGLGCPNGCDFCCTSHFFQRKYVRFLETGRDIYEALMKTRARARLDGVPMSSFVIIDEDFFLQERRAREFLRCVREGGEALTLMGFGSVRGLSSFTAREIAEMGFELIWNAFEGKKAGYEKQRGRSLADLYGDLKAVGCGTLTSMIIGFPYQDEAAIRAEFEELMALEPGMMQCLIYFAFPGTPFHRQVIGEQRYAKPYREAPDLRRWDGFSMHFDHPKFERPEMVEELQRELYREDYRRLGPSILRLGRVWLTGWENLKNDESPILRQRAELLRASARSVLPTLRTMIDHGGLAEEAKDRARALRRDLIRLTGSMTIKEEAYERLAPLFFRLSRRLEQAGVLQQPGLLRTEHRTASAGTSRDGLHSGAVFALQGRTGKLLARALRDDLGSKAARFLDARLGSPRREANPTPPAARLVTTEPCSLERSVEPLVHIERRAPKTEESRERPALTAVP